MSDCQPVSCPNCGSDDIHLFTEHISCSSTLYCNGCRKVKVDVPLGAGKKQMVRIWNEHCKDWTMEKQEVYDDV